MTGGKLHKNTNLRERFQTIRRRLLTRQQHPVTIFQKDLDIIKATQNNPTAGTNMNSQLYSLYNRSGHLKTILSRKCFKPKTIPNRKVFYKGSESFFKLSVRETNKAEILWLRLGNRSRSPPSMLLPFFVQLDTKTSCLNISKT